MNFDIGWLIAFLVQAFQVIGQLIGFGKGTLETAKTAKELFDDTKSLIDNPEKREKGIEQARIVAELLRSYALFGILEYLYRTTLVALAFLVLRQIMNGFRKK